MIFVLFNKTIITKPFFLAQTTNFDITNRANNNFIFYCNPAFMTKQFKTHPTKKNQININQKTAFCYLLFEGYILRKYLNHQILLKQYQRYSF